MINEIFSDQWKSLIPHDVTMVYFLYSWGRKPGSLYNIHFIHPAWEWMNQIDDRYVEINGQHRILTDSDSIPCILFRDFTDLRNFFHLNIFEPFLTYCMFYWNATGHYVSQASLLTTFIILSSSNTLTMDALTVTGLAASELQGSWRWMMEFPLRCLRAKGH